MLAGKNIVLTSCLSELGKQTMISLAENGANIFACICKHTDEFKDFCKTLEAKNHVHIIPVCFNMSDNDETEAAVKKIHDKSGNIHGLINLAKINREITFCETTRDDLTEILQTNFIFPIVFTQNIVKYMLLTGGSIAFISDVVAFDGKMCQTAYAASMAALLGAMRSMAIELGGKGIRINAVTLGFVKELGTEPLIDETIQKEIFMTDLKRIGTPREVANVLLFLMSDMSSHITGQTIRVDGGIR